MKNAEMKLMAFDNCDVITASVATLTVKGYCDNVFDNQTLTGFVPGKEKLVLSVPGESGPDSANSLLAALGSYFNADFSNTKYTEGPNLGERTYENPNLIIAGMADSNLINLLMRYESPDEKSEQLFNGTFTFSNGVFTKQ